MKRAQFFGLSTFAGVSVLCTGDFGGAKASALSTWATHHGSKVVRTKGASQVSVKIPRRELGNSFQALAQLSETPLLAKKNVLSGRFDGEPFEVIVG